MAMVDDWEEIVLDGDSNCVSSNVCVQTGNKLRQ